MANVNLYDLSSVKIEDENLKKDFQNAKKFGPISVGQLGVYYKDMTKRKAVRLSDIDHVFTRVHEISTHVCCGKCSLYTFGLVLNKDGRELAEFKTENENHVNMATEEILRVMPRIKSGYFKE